MRGRPVCEFFSSNAIGAVDLNGERAILIGRCIDRSQRRNVNIELNVL